MPRDVPGARPRWPLAAVGLGAALLVVFGVVACQSSPPRDVGAATVAALASASPHPTPASASTKTDAPRELRIPAMKLDVTVAAVGVNARTGEFDVPPSVDRVGWYKYGPGVSSAVGSIVIAGHVDSAAQGKGAFFRLGELARGDRVFLDDREFAVVARERYRKTEIPLDRYFARDGDLRLTLITCGGAFDARTGHYRDNVVVTATPIQPDRP